MNTAEQTKPNPQATIDKLGLKVSSVFVPFSQSRNKGEKHLSLNWSVTLYTLSPLDGQRRDILTTDYSAGSGHAPSSKKFTAGGSHLQHEAVKWECENGSTARVQPGGAIHGTREQLQPETLDVICSLVMDANVLDVGGFEEWATDLGYDPDSRAAEKMYQACLDTALKLRRGIGEHGLEQLREAFQDY